MCIIHNIIVREFFMTHACMYVVFKCDLLQGQNTYILFFFQLGTLYMSIIQRLKTIWVIWNVRSSTTYIFCMSQIGNLFRCSFSQQNTAKRFRQSFLEKLKKKDTLSNWCTLKINETVNQIHHLFEWNESPPKCSHLKYTDNSFEFLNSLLSSKLF